MLNFQPLTTNPKPSALESLTINIKATVDGGALGVAGYSLGAGRAVRGAASNTARGGEGGGCPTRCILYPTLLIYNSTFTTLQLTL
jgi:hypothetical protein